MKQKIIDALTQIGLTKTETKVYLTLLELGEALTGTIADKANLYRKNAYDALNRLHKKGLVSFVIKYNRKQWKALNPRRLTSIMNEKMSQIKSVIPELSMKFKAKPETKEVVYFEGLEGMKSFFDSMHKEGKNVYLIGSTGKAFTILKDFQLAFLKKMNKLGKKYYVLWNFDAENKELSIKLLKTSKNRMMPKNFSTPTQIFIYGDKAGILIWSDEPLCVLIKSKDIAKGFKKYFDFMWNISDVIK